MFYNTGQTIRDIENFDTLRPEQQLKHKQLQALAQAIERTFPRGAPSVHDIWTSITAPRGLSYGETNGWVREAIKLGYLTKAQEGCPYKNPGCPFKRLCGQCRDGRS